LYHVAKSSIVSHTKVGLYPYCVDCSVLIIVLCFHVIVLVSFSLQSYFIVSACGYIQQMYA